MVDEPDHPDLSVIEAGLQVVKAKTQPDGWDVAEQKRAEDERQNIEIARLQEELATLKSDRELRETYGNRILRFLEFYAGVVGVIVVADGVTCLPFSIPEAATVALVGSTAVAAIGLVGFVAKGLFDKSRS